MRETNKSKRLCSGVGNQVGLWASKRRGGHRKETSMSELHKVSGRRLIPSLVCP